MSSHGIPPNGFQGSAQQSHAVRNHLQKNMGASKALGTTSGKRKRKVRKPQSAGTTVRNVAKRAATTAGITILKKGSAAAKAWGAKMQKMRKKKAKAAGP